MKTQTKLIAIAGGSGAGKTRLAEQLQTALGAENVARLSLDDFYKDNSHLPLLRREQINYDHPDAIDWTLFWQTLCDCRAGRTARVPRYDFSTHTRQPQWETFAPLPTILVEGLWPFYQPPIAKLFDVKIFLACPAALRLERRLARDVTERGRTPESVRAQFRQTVAPMHDRFVEPQRKWADFVLQSPLAETELDEFIRLLKPPVAPVTKNELSARVKLKTCLIYEPLCAC